MQSRSRRRLLESGCSMFAGLFVAGCSGSPLVNDEEPAGTQPVETTTEPNVSGPWVPKPSATNGQQAYLISDVVFWKLDRIRSYKSDLYPTFYSRIAADTVENNYGIPEAKIDERIDVSSQSASIYVGQFDREQIGSTLEKKGLEKDGETGSFEIFSRGASHLRPVGVGENAIIVGRGASIQMAGGDDRSSEIDSKAALDAVIDVNQSNAEGYADQNDAHRVLMESAQSFDLGTVRTFERVSQPDPERLDFIGCIGVADGAKLSRPRSAYIMTFLFSDRSEVVTDPITEQYEQHPGLNEFDDVSITTDGPMVTVEATMENERFDAYLPGDPADRA